MTADTDALVEHLDRALDAVLVVRVALGVSNVPVPAEALDAALGAGDGYLRRRQRFGRIVSRLLDTRPEQHQAVFDLEAEVNALVATAVEIGWRVAMSTRRTP